MKGFTEKHYFSFFCGMYSACQLSFNCSADGSPAVKQWRTLQLTGQLPSTGTSSHTPTDCYSFGQLRVAPMTVLLITTWCENKDGHVTMNWLLVTDDYFLWAKNNVRESPCDEIIMAATSFTGHQGCKTGRSSKGPKKHFGPTCFSLQSAVGLAYSRFLGWTHL